MLIFSLMISMSALAFEVSFDKTEEKGESFDTGVVIVPAITENGSIGEGAVTFTAIYHPEMTAPAPDMTWAPSYTEKPDYTENPNYTGPVYDTASPSYTNEATHGGKDEETKPHKPPVTLEGETRLYAGNTFGYSVYVNEPMAVKAGAISISFNPDVFSIDYMGWYLSTSPVVISTSEEQRNGVFAYASAEYIQGEIFYFTLRVNEYVSYGPEDISVDIILKDENQNDIEVEDPTLHAYVGCQDHYFNAVIDSSALANPATCHSYAEYYYTCTNCGMLDYSTFTDYDGGFADHSIRDAWHANDEVHWHGCDNCHDMDTDMDKHSFGKWLIVKEATKEELGIRECSCTVCGYTKAENFKYKPAGSNTDAEDTEPAETTAAVITVVTEEDKVTVTIGGCNSSVALGAIAVLPALTLGALLVKKKED